MELMSHHPLVEITARACLGALVAMGELGFGWLLAFHSQSLVSVIDILRPPKSETLRKVVVICGYILMTIGGLCIAGYIAILLWPLFQH